MKKHEPFLNIDEDEDGFNKDVDNEVSAMMYKHKDLKIIEDERLKRALLGLAGGRGPP